MSKQDYIFRRRGPGAGKFWQMRLVIPARNGRPRRIIDVSTRCEKYGEALEWAIPRILEHQQRLARDKVMESYINSPSSPSGWTYEGTGLRFVPNFEMTPGSKPRKLSDGSFEQISVDGKSIVTIDATGGIAVRENRIRGERLLYEGECREHRSIRKLEAMLGDSNPEIEDDLDEKVIKAWIKARNVRHTRELDARNAYKTLKKAAPNRDFATFNADDVRKMVGAWDDAGHSTEDMEKKRGHLRGMINVVRDNARKDLFPQITENIFVGDYIPKGRKGKRAPARLITEHDHKLIMVELPNWPISLARLYLLGKCCGLRQSECFSIVSEETIDGIRCMEVCDDPNAPGKNSFANRLVPIPTALLPYMPAHILGSLFEHSKWHTMDEMMKRIRAALERHGIKHAGKTHHSLRHGIETDLGNAQVNQKIVDAILGHVPDDLKQNAGDNQQIRSSASIKYRYFHGNKARAVLDALNLIRI